MKATLNKSARRQFIMSMAIATVSVLALPVGAWAYDENAATAVNVDSNGLALKGYDPVAYFDTAGPTVGSSKWTAQHDGGTYRFTTAAHRDMFKANPAKFVPMYGGFCAMGVALEKKLDVDPMAWRVVDGKLYLNVNKDVQKRWLDDVPGHIDQANKNWPKLKDRTPKSL